MTKQNEETTTSQIEHQEVEDDLRCGECGSTEAGSCFYCKTD